MPAIVRLSKKELIDLIEETEAAGCDAACLRGLLAEVEEEERLEKPARRLPPPGIRPEEMTTEERLEAKVGALFPGGITGKVLADVIEFDRDHTLAEIKEMCVEAGLSTSGSKKELAAKLLARGIK